MPYVTAENHPQWKGQEASVNSIHRWVKKRFTKPGVCADCRTKPPVDLANISSAYNPTTYTREMANWVWLCRRCHMVRDGRMGNLRRGSKPTTKTCPDCPRPHFAKGLCELHYRRARVKCDD